jgi:hypothetical protein
MKIKDSELNERIYSLHVILSSLLQKCNWTKFWFVTVVPKIWTPLHFRKISYLIIIIIIIIIIIMLCSS